jgi:hypothetical protein
MTTTMRIRDRSTRPPAPSGRPAAMAALLLATAMALSGPAHAQPQDSAAAAALRARHAALQAELASNAFQRPLHLASTQSDDSLKGEVHAVVPHPFASVGPALQVRENWCDILILHLNVKQCRATPAGGLSIHIGKKFDQPLADTYRVDFGYKVAARGDDHFQIQLTAPEGPLGTRDYRIVIEAVPLDNARTFVHMSYSYRYGMAARMAMQAYLGTLGSDKVGFSVVGRRPDGQPLYVGNVRGVVERNTMRYYLAIESFLNARSAPPGQQQAKRLKDWFAATERYPRQLHEIDENVYLEMKQKELRRQQTAS